MSKKSVRKQVSELNKEQKRIHTEEVDEIIYQTYEANEFKSRLKQYNNIKKMRWFHYLISLTITIFLTGLSFLIGYLAVDSFRAPNYQASGWASLSFGVLIILIMMILNWLKNRNSAKHFNDKRRRYQRTLSTSEAKVFLTNKILFLSLILLTPVIIVTNIVFN